MKKIIKVLHTEWSDGWGGQEIRIISEMLLMQELGVEVFLACREHSEIRKKAQDNNLQVYVFPFKGNTDLKTLIKLKSFIVKNNINILNSHSSKDTWIGGFAAKFAGIKFIRTRHLSIPIKKSRLNFINELADYVFTTGESVRLDMINSNRINPMKIKSIPTGIDSSKFNPIHFNFEKSRALFNLNSEDIVIGMISVLRRFKRHDRFIEMARNVVDLNPNKSLKFIIAGDGPQRESINNLISKFNLNENFLLLGHVEKVPELINALDIFILASDSGEGVSQSLMQALMMETATISTNVGSTSDLYLDNNFQMIDIDSQEQLNRACNELILNENLRQSYQKKSRSYVVENFSNEKMIEKITGVYDFLIS
jgi:glycosyltransferase involved in cell wall biosynthesis